ncbi:response regulator transcription factor [Pedobacter alluvionis]|uniref:DNA-binding response OmpR family regulator n=1 Tax=Pedobacter alluvionis TaxID=475253 RepID=A0A497YL56_9SPHI|nr:response regulator transcription factor [Pedobacter alluvionis]RLJ80810.1 DNA-binding response OmpR family regulator [Pedobacter alluvionis]TFB32052.1 response regulator transcription factor [Pedobacter alluvionis]
MKKIKVLYAEDEPFLARIVFDGLSSSGYEVNLALDGQLAWTQFQKYKPDICVLDIMMPQKDGYTLATEIRKSDPNIPIIFLSAKALTEDVVMGFKNGGNDYLKKPFSIDELLVRMESLLKRFGHTQKEESELARKYQFMNCELDPVAQRLKTSVGEYSLSYKETVLLELLLKNRNSILEREDALIKIWGEDSFYNGRSMDVFMAHLRKLLKSEPEIQIISLRGVGYKLIC